MSPMLVGSSPAAPVVVCSLDQVAPDEAACVRSVGGNPSLRRRLLELGFGPGVAVHLLRRAPLGDPITVRLRGYHLSLRLAQARAVQVERNAPAAPRPDAQTAASVRSVAPTRSPQRWALIGNPNAGKTSLFNALTGLRQRVANYPGVTVTIRHGSCRSDPALSAIDLPGTYSLTAQSPDERLAVELLTGRAGTAAVADGVLAVVDAANLPRNLLLLTQVLELGLPVVVALTMTDLAAAAGAPVDPAALSLRLGVPVIALAPPGQRSLDELHAALAQARCAADRPWQAPQLAAAAQRLGQQLRELAPRQLGSEAPELAALRLLTGADHLPRYAACGDERLVVAVERTRQELAGIDALAADLAARYAWIDSVVAAVAPPLSVPVAELGWRGRADAILLHRGGGLAVFALVMAALFASIFSLAPPLSDLIEAGLGWATQAVTATLPRGVFAELATDGILAGVGAVLVFIPPIALLFLLLGTLEDCGYLARAATLLDRALARFGLSGAAFVPLLSAHACAIPAVLAARHIPAPRERLVTILVAPFLSCSARLPVYLLLVGMCFAGAGVLVQTSAYLGLYLVGIIAALGTAWAVRCLGGHQAPPSFLMELPPLRLPQPASVLRSAAGHTAEFVKKAFTVIFACSVLLWVLVAFPRQTRLVAGPDGVPVAESVAPPREDSYAGRFGRAIEPAIAPLGYDWKMGIGLLAAFGAREAFVGAMGVVHGLAEDEVEDETGRQTLTQRLRADTRVIGHDAEGAPILAPVWTTPAILSLLVFFALAMQCMSTLAVVRQETGGWRWPLFQLLLMSGLAYLAALAVFQLGTWWSSGP